MSTMTGDREDLPIAIPARGVQVALSSRCTRCKLSYAPAKSTSSLRLTYCSFLCELGDLGFSMAGLEHMTLKKKDALPVGEPVAIE